MDQDSAHTVAAPAPAALDMAPPPAAAPKYSPAFTVRVWSALIAFVCASMLGLGLYMKPSTKGVGTHAEALHLPPCGFLQFTGFPCPTCGCTTAVTHVAHGNLWQAIKTQPFGAAVGVLGAVMLVLSALSFFRGKWIWPSTFWLEWYWRELIIGGVGLLILGWIYKSIAIRNGF